MSPLPTYLRFCVDILFRTFLDILLLYTPWFTALHFLDFLFPSLTPNFLSKILRGHIVPHFLRFPLTPHSLFTALRSLFGHLSYSLPLI